MKTKMIRTEHRDKVFLIKLSKGVTNALDLPLVNELTTTLQTVKNNPDVHALVLGSSSDKFFSIGFDIPQLFELSQQDFQHFYQAFNRVCIELFTLPKPTVAAITGHAVAGGCILTLCCDYRFIADGRKLMGLNEIKLGVPVPYPGDCILRHLVGVRHARDIMDTGDFYQPEALLDMGVVDQVLPQEQVQPESIEKAALLGALPQEAFAIIKRNRVEPIETQIRSRLEKKEQLFLEHWYSHEVRERLKAAMEKF